MIEVSTATKTSYRFAEVILQSIKVLIDLAKLGSRIAEEILHSVVAATVLEVDGKSGAILSPGEPEDVPGRLDVDLADVPIQLFGLHRWYHSSNH